MLREGSKCRQLEADYTTPAGRKLRIAVTVSPVPAVDGSLLGAACLISDRSEFERIRHQQELHGEISAEMALELRTSLTTIAGYAQQLARNRDPELAPQLAADIASEARVSIATSEDFWPTNAPLQPRQLEPARQDRAFEDR